MRWPACSASRRCWSTASPDKPVDPDGRRDDRPRREPGDGRPAEDPPGADRERASIGPETAVIMVDTQPHTGRRASEADTPHLVIDHHETGGDLDGGPLPRRPRPDGRDEHDGDRLPARAGGRRLVAAGDRLALRDRVGDLGLSARGRLARRRGPGLALPPRRQGPARPDPQPQAPPEPLRHVPARPGERLPVPRRGRELVRPASPSPTSSPSWPTSSSASTRSTGPSDDRPLRRTC